MQRLICLLGLTAALIGCDATEEAVLSDQPMDKFDGSVTGDLAERQEGFVDGTAENGLLNDYEKQQAEAAIGEKAPAQ